MDAIRQRLAAGDPGSGDHGVWPENAPAVEAFLAVATQWRVVAGPERLRVVGLDYAGARAGWDLAGIAMTPALFADVRIMEAAAIAALNEGG